MARAPDVIERNARMQAQLIADILDVSRIVSGKLQLDVQRVDLGAVVRAAVDAVRPAADAKDIRIDVAVTGPAEVAGDADRLQQVVWNLLSNAIKFSDRGSSVRVGLEADAAEALLMVQDDGAGIAPEFLPHVFERFRQADGSYARAHGGVGLGLAIVRHLVESHGGTVTAVSPGLGKGATLKVRIPRARGVRPTTARSEAREAEMASAATRGPLPRLDGVHVLVVDDDPDTLHALEIILKSRGAEVATASSVARARESVLQHAPHVVLCDIGMPMEDGYDLLRWLRDQASKGLAPVAAVAVTAYVADRDRNRALDGGFDAYIAKPLNPDDVVRVVARMRAGLGDREG